MAATSEGVVESEAERAVRKSRVVQRRVLLTISPLIATLVVPWPVGFSWEVADRLNTSAFMAIPATALVATLVALAGKRALVLRSLVLGALGLGLGTLFFDVVSQPALLRELPSDARRWDAYVLYLGLTIPLLAVTLELFAALDRRSRPRAVVAGLGWLALAGLYVLPFRSDRLEEMPLLFMAEAAADAAHRPENLLIVGPLALLLMVALLAAALTLLRLVGDPERRERWRPQSGCLGIALGTGPAALVLLGLSLAAAFDEGELLGAAYNGAFALLGFSVGVPVAVASGLDGLAAVFRLARGRGEVRSVRRARFAVGAVSAALAIACLAPLVGEVLPDRREARAADELLDVAAAVVEASRGGAVAPRFLGGYSEFDLRASVGLFGEVFGEALGPGAEPTLEYATFEILVVGETRAAIEVGVSPDGELRYLGGRRGVPTTPPAGSLGRASESLAALAERIDEGLSSLLCLPAAAPPDLPGLLDRQSSVAPLCRREATSRRRRIRDIGRGGDGGGGGGTGRYRLWVRAGETVHRLEGRLFSHEGRLWIGRAALDSPPGDPSVE